MELTEHTVQMPYNAYSLFNRFICVEIVAYDKNTQKNIKTHEQGRLMRKIF